MRSIDVGEAGDPGDILVVASQIWQGRLNRHGAGILTAYFRGGCRLSDCYCGAFPLSRVFLVDSVYSLELANSAGDKIKLNRRITAFSEPIWLRIMRRLSTVRATLAVGSGPSLTRKT